MNRFLTHFSTVAIIHLMIVLGGGMAFSNLGTSLSEAPKMMKVSVATRVFMGNSFTSQIPATQASKKTSRPKPLTPSKNPTAAPTTKVSDTDVVSVEEGAAGGILGASNLAGMARGDLKNMYQSELRAKINANKFYPVISRRLGQTGLVVVAFTLLGDGSIINIRVATSSRFERLDESALEAVKKTGRFKPIPAELGESKMEINVPVKFSEI